MRCSASALSFTGSTPHLLAASSCTSFWSGKVFPKWGTLQIRCLATVPSALKKRDFPSAWAVLMGNGAWANTASESTPRLSTTATFSSLGPATPGKTHLTNANSATQERNPKVYCRLVTLKFLHFLRADTPLSSLILNGNFLICQVSPSKESGAKLRIIREKTRIIEKEIDGHAPRTYPTPSPPRYPSLRTRTYLWLKPCVFRIYFVLLQRRIHRP